LRPNDANGRVIAGVPVEARLVPQNIVESTVIGVRLEFHRFNAVGGHSNAGAEKIPTRDGTM
jgi:hypothetical protein